MRWQEYTEELYKKDLNDPENHNGVITHLEPDILEAKWALESTTKKKVSGGEEIPAGLFHIIKDDAVKVPHSICQQFGKLSSGHRTGKWSVSPKKSNPKECSKHGTTALISQASKVMLKILQARFQQYMNGELPDVQAGFRKGRGTREHIVNMCWIIEKSKRVPKKRSISAFLTMPKPLTVWITTNCGKFFNRLEYQTT